MRPARPRLPVRVVALTQGAVLTSLVAVLGLGALLGHHEHDPVAARRIATLTAFNSLPHSDAHCPTMGADSAKVSAVISTTKGHLRHVTFSEGWDVFLGRSPGALVAICSPQGS